MGNYLCQDFILTPEKGSFRYGSPSVHLVADATVPGGLGTFGYDDEGIEAQRTDLIVDGIFQNYLTSRELNQCSIKNQTAACARLAGENLPMVRMTNINWSRAIGHSMKSYATRKRIFVDTPKRGLDDKRLNFHFGRNSPMRLKRAR